MILAESFVTVKADSRNAPATVRRPGESITPQTRRVAFDNAVPVKPDANDCITSIIEADGVNILVSMRMFVCLLTF